MSLAQRILQHVEPAFGSAGGLSIDGSPRHEPAEAEEQQPFDLFLIRTRDISINLNLEPSHG